MHQVAKSCMGKMPIQNTSIITEYKMFIDTDDSISRLIVNKLSYFLSLVCSTEEYSQVFDKDY